MEAAKRNIGLDVLRASAISMVILAHGVTLDRIPILGQFGTGVDLFFVLSGFLIGRIYFRTRKQEAFRLGGFWIARWWRTIPPYLAAVALFAIASHWVAGESVRWYYLLFAQNYAGIDGFGPSWSLCVEEHFYLLLPLFGFLVERLLGRRSFLWVLPTVFFFPLALRLGTLGWTGTLPRDWYWMTHFHCEGLIAGVWLAYLFVERHDLFLASRRVALWLLPLLPILLAILPVWHTRGLWFDCWIFTLLAVGYASWTRVLYDLKWGAVSATSKRLRSGVTALALASYSIYLVHVLIDHLLRARLHGWARGAVKTGTILLVTLLLSSVFYFLIERTTILSRDRFLKGRRIGALPEAAEVLPRAASAFPDAASSRSGGD